MSRADQIYNQLDQLTAELKDLASTPRAKRHIDDLRTYLGLRQGGYVGQPNVGELLEDGEFKGDEDEDEDEDE